MGVGGERVKPSCYGNARPGIAVLWIICPDRSCCDCESKSSYSIERVGAALVGHSKAHSSCGRRLSEEGTG